MRKDALRWEGADCWPKLITGASRAGSAYCNVILAADDGGNPNAS
jgi:hypothetical protein